MEGENGETIQAYGYDRAVTARENGIGMYSMDEGEGMTYYGKLPIVTEFKPENLHLHNNEG